MKSWKSTLTFAVVSIVMLGIVKADLLFHMEQYSLFNFDWDWLVKFFEQAGGVLSLLGAFLTQFCHFPIVGALLLTALLIALQRIVRASFGLEGRNEWMAYVPSLMLLLFVTRFDYSIFLQKTYGLVFSQTLGFIASVSVFLLYKKCVAGKKAAWAFIPVLVLIGYPLLGAYAFVSALLIVLESFRTGSLRWVNLVTAVVFCVAVPLICSYSGSIFLRINRKYIFFAGFPYLEFVKDIICFIPLILTILSLALLVFASKMGPKAAVAVSAFALIVAVGGTNWDPNFNAVMKMERGVTAQDWDKVLKVADKRETPTRIQVLFRDIALYHKGQLTEKMFSYPDGSAALATKAYVPITIICSAPVCYYCGMINTGERMCMEISSSYTKCINFFKYQAKIALITGEYALAQKYVDAVAKNWFQGAWVRRYQGFIDDPSSMDTDKEFMMIRPLMAFEEEGVDTSLTLETLMFNHFIRLNYYNENLYEWQMAMLMVQKREYVFMQKFYDHYDMFPNARISTGIAQAAALFAGISGDREMLANIAAILSSHKSVLREFGNFGRIINSGMDDEKAAEAAKDRFGRTYWFYYYFINDMETN